ncbi:hypothetical protein D9M71_147900 [compost metagenome]|uniref:Uncharacterized protein n=1 Tax=Pseudomonas jinjuensis TaxID=198616 RepID=A0A1H0JEE0_9PSED|nr:MFS transporter [Pseudomonas jinjuensis]SDO42004.1 hypothetical protein SAMN05216193_11150 [Pseudomonas jinjuensis]
METWLILGGLVLILAGYVWFVILAFGCSLLSGIASLVPPFALWPLLRHWSLLRRAVVLGALGWIPLVVGLTLLASHDSARLEAILGLDWLRPAPTTQAELAIDLRGEFRGEPFVPAQAELIDGVLSLREGGDFYARRELRISLPAQPDGPLRLDVLPGDRGTLPEVEINWLEPDRDLPEARRLARGYTLRLDLAPEPPNRLRGEFHLVLPAEYRTALSGQVELYTDRLRYRDGQVDTRFDSPDTIAYVLRDYLQRRFARSDIQLTRLPRLDLRRHQLSVPLAFSVDGQPEWLRVDLYRSASRGWAVRDDHYPKPAPAEPVAPVAIADDKPAAAGNPPPEPPAQGALTLERLRAAPQHFVNQRIRVVTQRGGTAEGAFAGLDSEGRIIIRRLLGGAGEASYSLHPSDITHIELLPR